MAKLDERELARSYLGKTCCEEKLSEVFYGNGIHTVDIWEDGKVRRISDCAVYIADCYNYSEELRNTFGITPVLLERWGYYGIEFSVYIYIKDGTVVSCKVSKYKNTSCGGHGRPSGYELLPTQQELRIFRRVMDYVVCEVDS